MASASSMECCKAFMSWVERFGVPRLAISDNGNSFISNLYKDIMNTFNIKVNFTPAYHAATNGMLERRHQTIKNALKASLVDMGNHHGSKWTSALPWVLLGKRAALQPDLDASASMLAFGKSPDLPGQLLGHPGPPLSNLQTRSLLEELYKLENKTAIQTSATVNPIDISYTNKVTHVYVKIDEPRGLNPRFEGPYRVIHRPSRSTVTVRVGSFVDGTPRLLTYNWSSCKPAHLREDAVEGSRPNIGRRPNPSTSDVTTTNKQHSASGTISATPETSGHETSSEEYQHPSLLPAERRNFETYWNHQTPPLAETQPALPAPASSARPIRTTRNPNPRYVDAVASPA